MKCPKCGKQSKRGVQNTYRTTSTHDPRENSPREGLPQIEHGLVIRGRECGFCKHTWITAEAEVEALKKAFAENTPAPAQDGQVELVLNGTDAVVTRMSIADLEALKTKIVEDTKRTIHDAIFNVISSS